MFCQISDQIMTSWERVLQEYEDSELGTILTYK